MPEPEPRTVEEAVMAIQQHRAAIVEAQHKVIRGQLPVAEYNVVYKRHLDAIHALEAKVAELQTGPGGGAAGLY